MARNRTLAFLGLGKKKSEKAEETEDERAAREKTEKDAAAAAEASAADEEDEDEEDEDEDGAEGDDRKAIRTRNALRGAGHRRGVTAERVRIGAIMNGVEPARADMALHLALNTDLPAAQARAAVDKAPKGGGSRTPFATAMEHFKPPVGAGGGERQGAPPTLASRMAETLKAQTR